MKVNNYQSIKDVSELVSLDLWRTEVLVKPLNPVDLGTKAKLLLSDSLFPNTDVEAFRSQCIQCDQLLVTSLPNNKSAKLRALHACVPTCLACLYVFRVYVVTWSHAHASRVKVPCVLTWHLALRTYVLTVYVPCVLTCHCVSRVLLCSRVNVPCVLCVLTWSRAVTTNDKYSFPYIFVIVLCLSSVK